MRMYLGLGSNLGDSKKYLQKAISRINTFPNIKGIKKSSIYQSKALEVNSPQNDYLNMVISFVIPDFQDNYQSANSLWKFLSSIEKSLGRKRIYFHEPRTIDIDILIYGKLKVNNQLIIPHPRVIHRLFVLEPMLEVINQLTTKKSAITEIEILLGLDNINQRIFELKQIQDCQRLS